MLSDQITELLTAYVDRELSERERKIVERLLKDSSEARQLLRQLQENAHSIKQLPRYEVSPSLVNDVVNAIKDQGIPKNRRERSKVGRRRSLPYFAISLAASALICVIGVLYWISMNEPARPKKNPGPTIAEKKSQNQIAPDAQPSPRKMPNLITEELVKITKDIFQGFVEDAPPVAPFAFHDLQSEGAATSRLKLELNREKAVELDMTVNNHAVALERLASVLHDHGINVKVDPNAAKSLMSNTPGEYWVYAENLTPDEVTKLLHELSLANTTGKKKEASPYQSVSLTQLTDVEKQQLSNVLGVDPAKINNPNDRPKAAGNKKPDPPDRWSRTAVVVPAKVGAKSSEEIRSFVDQLPRPSAGTIQVLMKIHKN